MSPTDPSAHAPVTNGPTALLEPEIAEVTLSFPAVEEIVAFPGTEPTAPEAVTDLAPAPALEQLAAPAPPIPVTLIRRRVAGRYGATAGNFRLELRVDVDGPRPMRRVSGDFFRIQGFTTTYLGSWVVNTLGVTITPTLVTLTGTAVTTWPTSYNVVRITIPRVFHFSPPAPATVRWFNAAGQPGSGYLCQFLAPFFRTVDLEQDCETGVTPFVNYDTGALPSGGPARTLSVLTAFQEAGIEMRAAGSPNVIPHPAGGDWTDADLHNAMVNHFTLWREVPQWKVWLLHAQLHEMGPGLLGVMFDDQGRQRQGCAVFYQGLGGTTAEARREQLFTCVHELGHCFNLYHSFHKSYMTPPMPNRLMAYSWMNYPWRFPAGAAAFWSTFAFQFDDLETIHLRHGFRDNVIMGGQPFGTGAALNRDDFAEPEEDRSGLRLEVRAPRAFRLGEPVVVEFKLGLDGARSLEVESHLHPSAGAVRLAIRKPSGVVVIHDPILDKCFQPAAVQLEAARPSIYDSAYIGYGRQGLTFDAPGIYQVRAASVTADGSILVSNQLEIRVRPPRNEADEDAAEHLMGHDQGILFTLLGSDSKHLAAGNESLTELIDKYPNHPLTMYARLVIGFNAARAFTDVRPDGVTPRKAQRRPAESYLTAVIQASSTGPGLDNITLGQVYRRLARTQKDAGDTKAATATIDKMVALFEGKNLRDDILDTIRAQGKDALA